jgi:hypothetical protein
MLMKRSSGAMLIFAAILVLGTLIYVVLNQPDKRNSAQRITDAFDELDDGFDNASDQLKDRTPAEKLGDAAKAARNDIKKISNQSR